MGLRAVRHLITDKAQKAAATGPETSRATFGPVHQRDMRASNNTRAFVRARVTHASGYAGERDALPDGLRDGPQCRSTRTVEPLLRRRAATAGPQSQQQRCD